MGSLPANRELQSIAARYCRQHDMAAPTEGHYIEIDRARSWEIAVLYEHLPEVSREEETVLAYHALENEVLWQWNALRHAGYRLLPWECDGQPYADSREMRADVREHKRLWFFTGGDPHPFLGTLVGDTGLTGNDMLRAIHDCFGHAAEGYGFGQRGEENAWLHHSMMFSPLAQRALTTETRGQNSWVNAGPYAHLPASERPFAALLPAWVCDWRAALAGA